MGELLPLLIGCGIALVFAGPARGIRPVAPVACVLGGALASAINVELNGALWALFVSLDAALVWVGAAATTALLWAVGRRPTVS